MAKIAAKTKAKPENKSRAVALKKNAAATNVSVDLLEEQDAGKGVSTDVADNVVPLLKILQPLSPQVIKQKKQDYIPGAEAGMIWPRGEKQVWDGEEEGIRIVPCYYERVWLEWGPERGDGLKGRHANGTDDTPRELGATKKTDNNGNERWVMPGGNVLQDNRQHVVLVLDKYAEPTPFVLPMTGSNISTSRNWHPVMNKKRTKKGAKAASYRYVYQLTSVPRENDKGAWHQMAITDLDERTPDDIYLIARQIHADFSGGVLVADADSPHEVAIEDPDDM
jgi:hypothetical protein